MDRRSLEQRLQCDVEGEEAGEGEAPEERGSPSPANDEGDGRRRDDNDHEGHACDNEGVAEPGKSVGLVGGRNELEDVRVQPRRLIAGDSDRDCDKKGECKDSHGDAPPHAPPARVFVRSAARSVCSGRWARGGLQPHSEPSVRAIQVDPGDGKRVSVGGAQGKCAFVTHGACHSAHSRIVLAVRIGEEPAGAPELVLETFLRSCELGHELRVPNACQVGVRDRVRSDLDAHAGPRPKLVPSHRLYLGLEAQHPLREFGNDKRQAVVGKRRAREDRHGHPEPPQIVENRANVPVRIIEGHVQHRTGRQRLFGVARTGAFLDQLPHLPH